MVLLPDSPSSFYVAFGLNNIVARETRVEVRCSSFSFYYWTLDKRAYRETLTDQTHSLTGRHCDEVK